MRHRTHGARRRPRFGLALGSGAGRGWAHIGVLRVLAEAGLAPDVVVGCSVGALVGGCHASGRLDAMEAFARGLTRRRLLGMMDFQLAGGGLIAGAHLGAMLEREVGTVLIEDLAVPFGCVATEMPGGHEVWLTRGGLSGAIRASYALPGIFEPVEAEGRLLMDGALVNPIPVTLARSLGADVVACVNLNADHARGAVVHAEAPAPEPAREMPEPPRWWSRWRREAGAPRRPAAWTGAAATLAAAFNISQDRIARSRLAGDPPDLAIAPRLAGVGLFDFHRADDLIALGRSAAERALPDIEEAMGRGPVPAPR